MGGPSIRRRRYRVKYESAECCTSEGNFLFGSLPFSFNLYFSGRLNLNEFS